jgi:hypothetical protein
MIRQTLLACGTMLIVLAAVAETLAQNNPNTKPLAATAWRLAEPINYKNMIIFPVVSDRPASAETSHFTTLDEALSSGEAVIREQKSEPVAHSAGRHGRQQEQQEASVNQLVLVYRGQKQLLLLAGELVQGGDQDRIISQDRIVPPGSEPLPLDVFCVEQGRWSSGEEFASGRMIAHPSVREKAAVDQEQTKVWQAVLAGSTAMTVAGGPAPGLSSGRAYETAAANEDAPVQVRRTSPAVNTSSATLSAQTVSVIVSSEARTSSYARIYRSSRVEDSVHPFVKEMQKRFAQRVAEIKGESIVGVVVSYGADIAWSDIFASPALFERYWPKLSRSYVIEALARPQTTELPSFDDAAAFLESLNGQETVENGHGPYNLRRVTQADYVQIDLEALRPVPVDLHTVQIHRTHGAD